MNRNRKFRSQPNAFANDLNKFIDELFTPATGHQNHSSICKHAPVNITESDDEYTLELQAAGWNKEDFNIKIEGEFLTISAKSKVEQAKADLDPQETADQPSASPDVKVIKREFKRRDFKRTFTLSDKTNKDSVEASYENGILTLTIAKLEAAKPVKKTIEIS